MNPGGGAWPAPPLGHSPGAAAGLTRLAPLNGMPWGIGPTPRGERDPSQTNSEGPDPACHSQSLDLRTQTTREVSHMHVISSSTDQTPCPAAVIYIATHDDGSQTLVTLWDATTGEVASRSDSHATWGIPTPLVVAP
jgi:hypothetical protein